MSYSTGLPDFTDKRFQPGDHVIVTNGTTYGRPGTIVRRCVVASDGWIVEWDTPVFGADRSRVATVHLEHYSGRQS